MANGFIPVPDHKQGRTINLALNDTRLGKNLQPPHILGPSYPAEHGDGGDEDGNGREFDPGDFSFNAGNDEPQDGEVDLEETWSQFPHLYLELSSDDEDTEADDCCGEEASEYLEQQQNQAMEVDGANAVSPMPATSIHCSLDDLENLIIGETASTSNQLSKRQRTTGSYKSPDNLSSTSAMPVLGRRRNNPISSRAPVPTLESKYLMRKSCWFILHAFFLSAPSKIC